ncbi:MAG: transposase [Chlamydiales bacterium]|nr:transposase [Chlamydiales bacterium]
MAYSHDLRTKALDYIERGKSKVETSQIFGVTVQTLIAWCKRKRQGK